MAKLDDYLSKLAEMNRCVKADNKAGNQWTYCNSSSKKANNWKDARIVGSKKSFKTNCVDLVQWACKEINIPSKALSWYGGKNGPVWLNANARKNAEKYFELINCNAKYTVSQLFKKRLMCPGDILVGFGSSGGGMNHTCVFYSYDGGGKSFDSGHAYAIGSGEGAKIQKVIGGLTAKGYKPWYLFRIKDRRHYCVQAGSYKTDLYKSFQQELLEKFGVKTSVIHKGEEYIVALGQYSCVENANYYRDEFLKQGIACQVREV